MSLDISLVKIPVSNVEAAAPFYRDVLGLAQEFVVGDFGWAQFSAGNLQLALYEPTKGDGATPAGTSDHIHFCTFDAEGFKDRLRDAGMTPLDYIQKSADGTVFFELRDPDGNVFRIFAG